MIEWLISCSIKKITGCLSVSRNFFGSLTLHIPKVTSHFSQLKLVSKSLHLQGFRFSNKKLWPQKRSLATHALGFSKMAIGILGITVYEGKQNRFSKQAFFTVQFPLLFKGLFTLKKEICACVSRQRLDTCHSVFLQVSDCQTSKRALEQECVLESLVWESF